jgi:hypothetical protein
MVNFGNGVIAGGSHRDQVRISDHDGWEFPSTEVNFREFGVLPGGVYTSTRPTTRLMTCRLDFTGYTRQQIAALFAPGEVRVVTTSRGSMPYVVEDLRFASPNLTRKRITVDLAIRSSEAYPIRDIGVVEAGSSTPLVYPFAYPFAYGSMDAVTSLALTNTGTVTAEPRIRLTASATATLTVTHSGGALALDVEVGDVVVIDSRTRTVTIDGDPALSALDPTSVFPILPPGTWPMTFSQPVLVSASWNIYELGLL